MSKSGVIDNNIEILSKLFAVNFSHNNSYADGISFFDSLRILTYIFPKTVSIGRYIVSDWIYDEKNKEDIIKTLEESEKRGNLREIQVNYCFIEPEMSLYGKENISNDDFDSIKNALLETIAEYWRYILGGSENSYTVDVVVEKDAGRVAFYQIFSQ